MRAVVLFAPPGIAGQDQWLPMTTTSCLKVTCFVLIIPPSILNPSNQSCLYCVSTLSVSNDCVYAQRRMHEHSTKQSTEQGRYYRVS